MIKISDYSVCPSDTRSSVAVSHKVLWNCDDGSKQQYEFSALGIGPVVVLLSDLSGFLIVHSPKDNPNNAVIVNTDGSERVRICIPSDLCDAICFGDAYYLQNELSLILFAKSWQLCCVIDEHGTIVRRYEMR